SRRLAWRVWSADGARLALGNPLNRVRATSGDAAVASVSPDADGSSGTVTAHAPGRTTLTLTYQREHASGAYVDVYNGRRPVSVQVTVVVTR
ncbi:MAG: Ig-like domain-containing protein, partial [Solirubrobacteraceae bacterium]